MVKYIKEEEYYGDLYDLMTIKECFRIRDYWDKKMKSLNEIEIKIGRMGLEFQLFYVKGERYRNKRAALQKWMQEDKKRDEKLNSAEAPKGISCVKCQAVMEAVFKDLFEMNCDSLRVLFFFECPKCGTRRGVFDDGQEFVSKEAKLTKAEMDEWAKEDAERKDAIKKDRELLKKFRSDFCLSVEQGEDYIMSSNNLNELSKFLKDSEQKKADPDYQKALELKKLPIVELEKFLKGILEEEKYIKLAFDKPMIDKHVIVPLTVQDADSSRIEYDSVHKLQKLLKKTLETTNWRLMNEGVNYRLGYLSCRLKGYEQEDDLLRIIKA